MRGVIVPARRFPSLLEVEGTDALACVLGPGDNPFLYRLRFPFHVREAPDHDSDLSPFAQPLPDRSKQRPWIAFFIDNLTALLRARSDLFISTNLTWFPRANEPESSPLLR
jgi:hypothetical protein